MIAGALLVAVFGFALPKIAAYDDVWAHARTMSRGDVVLLVVTGSWNIVTYWFVLMAALPGLGLWRAALSNQASTAVSNVVPGGGALGATLTWTMYRRWGFSRESSARALLATSAWSNLFKLGLPLVAIVLAVVAHGAKNPGPIALGVVALAIFGVTVALFIAGLRSKAAARRIGAALGRVMSVLRRDGRPRQVEWAGRADDIRLDLAELVARRWLVLTTSVIVSHIALFLVLLASIRAVGIAPDAITWSEALVAFAVVRVALVVPVTPGGAGMVELGLTGLLAAAGGAADEVMASVLVFRALTWLLPVGVGGVAYMVWLRELAR